MPSPKTLKRMPAVPNCHGPLSILHVRYHRNGIGGLGFSHVIFRDPENVPGDAAQHAIVLDADHDAETGNVCCFVITPSDPAFRWRGDRYAPTLRSVVEWASANPTKSHYHG